jgi:C_GCAxxG_C_C family probable redox protein
MPSGRAGPRNPPSAGTNRALGRRSTANLLRMGHCAPTVRQTLLEASQTEAPWLVKLAAGLPGGIGNSGGECGGVTAPLMLLGVRRGLKPDEDGLPMIVSQGHDLLRRFGTLQGATACREIRGGARVPLRCVRVIRQAPALCAQSLCGDRRGSLTVEQRRAYGRLYSHWVAKGFHCAQSVFDHLKNTGPGNDQVLAASSAFMGGTIFTGMTCSALTAGVMALGLKLGEIENSRLRVLRMVATMAIGGNAFEDKLNAFNRPMNLGHQLVRWFVARFGNTQCRQITGCDFSTMDDVNRYIERGNTARCQALVQHVAQRVQVMIESALSQTASGTE